MKQCISCNDSKDDSEFRPDPSRKDGLYPYCLDCQTLKGKLRYELNKNKIKKQSRNHYSSHKKERAIYRESIKPRQSIYMKNWRKENKQEIREYKNSYETKRRKNDVGYKILRNLAQRVRDSIHGRNKAASTSELVGCSIDELRAHLERQFTSGMTWANYGVKGWHIDHRKPCASFDLTIPEQQKECFNFSNLQPLWHTDNLKKGAKII